MSPLGVCLERTPIHASAGAVIPAQVASDTIASLSARPRSHSACQAAARTDDIQSYYGGSW